MTEDEAQGPPDEIIGAQLSATINLANQGVRLQDCKNA